MEYTHVYTAGWIDDLESIDYMSVYTGGWFTIADLRDESGNGNYLNYSSLPNGFITKCPGIDYNRERELYDIVLTEAYNKHGICLEYYVTSFDTSYDKVWGEDNNRTFTRAFQCMGFFELPQEERMWTKLGIAGMDEFSVYIAKRHFRDASKFNYAQTNPNAYNSYLPKIGDYIISKYNKYIYEVVDVKDEAMMFMQSKQYVWDLIVKPFKDEKIQTNAETSATTIADFTNKENDIYDQTSEVDTRKTNVIYTPKPSEQSINNGFSGW